MTDSLRYLLAPPTIMILPRLHPEEMKRLAKSCYLDKAGRSHSISEMTLIKVFFLSCFPYCFFNLLYNWTIYSIRQWPWALWLILANYYKQFSRRSRWTLLIGILGRNINMSNEQPSGNAQCGRMFSFSLPTVFKVNFTKFTTTKQDNFSLLIHR